MLAALILCVVASSALGRYGWSWTSPYLIVPEDQPSSTEEYYLTEDNGSHAVAMTKYEGYGQDTCVWTSILTQRQWDDWDPYGEYIGKIQAYEYQDIGDDWRKWDKKNPYWPFVPADCDSPMFRAVNCHVANNPRFKAYTWGRPRRSYPWPPPGGFGVPTDDRPLSYQGEPFWGNPHQFSAQLRDSMAKDMGVAVALFKGPNVTADSHGVAVWVSDHYDSIELRRALTSDGGANWHTGSGHYIVRVPSSQEDTWWRHTSLATDDQNGSNAYLAYESTWTNGSSYKIVFRRSTDWGDDWNQNVTVLGDGEGPCIAAVGHVVFVSWSKGYLAARRVLYRVSTDCGASWVPDPANPPDTVPFEEYVNPPRFRYGRQNVAAVPLPDGQPGFLVVAQLRFPYYVQFPEFLDWYTTRGMFVHLHGTTAYWQELMPLCTNFACNDGDVALYPSIAAIAASGLDNLPLPPGVQPSAIATCVMSTPRTQWGIVVPGHHIRKANGYYADRSYDAVPSASTARLLAIGSDGAVHYGNSSWPYVATGQIIYGAPIYDFGVTGKMPALAPDADGRRWVAYVDQDTVWCYPGEGEPELVFGRAGAAVDSVLSGPGERVVCKCHYLLRLRHRGRNFAGHVRASLYVRGGARHDREREHSQG
jgi:hypothetical protein